MNKLQSLVIAIFIAISVTCIIHGLENVRKIENQIFYMVYTMFICKILHNPKKDL